MAATIGLLNHDLRLWRDRAESIRRAFHLRDFAGTPMTIRDAPETFRHAPSDEVIEHALGGLKSAMTASFMGRISHDVTGRTGRAFLFGFFATA